MLRSDKRRVNALGYGFPGCLTRDFKFVATIAASIQYSKGAFHDALLQPAGLSLTIVDVRGLAQCTVASQATSSDEKPAV